MTSLIKLFTEQTATLESRSISEIRKQLTTILKGLFEIITLTINSISKLLYLTLFLLIIDAMNYMRKYYSDDSFDNDAVDGNLRAFWNKNKKSHLTPLRKWELNGKYHVARSLKISQEEAINIIWAIIPVVTSILLIMSIRFADMTFASVIY